MLLLFHSGDALDAIWAFSWGSKHREQRERLTVAFEALQQLHDEEQQQFVVAVTSPVMPTDSELQLAHSSQLISAIHALGMDHHELDSHVLNLTYANIEE